ncbi:MAG: YtxH domain-containing protein [Lautropia sp.]|nr:YtxH domain-containing protein [Lautropia sp.]
MLPLVPFVVGLAAGAATTGLLRRDSVRRKLENAGRSLRSAAETGIDSVRNTSASLRDTVSGTLKKTLPGRSAAPRDPGRQPLPARQATRAAGSRARAVPRTSIRRSPVAARTPSKPAAQAAAGTPRRTSKRTTTS